MRSAVEARPAATCRLKRSVVLRVECLRQNGRHGLCGVIGHDRLAPARTGSRASGFFAANRSSAAIPVISATHGTGTGRCPTALLATPCPPHCASQTPREAAMSASAYTQAYAAWRADPEAWWAAAAAGHHLGPTLGPRLRSRRSAPYGRWFPGATLNTCFNCLDRHVAAGRGDQPALIWDSPMTGRVETFTYRQTAAPHREAGRRAGRHSASRGRPGGDLPADGPRGGRSPCWPAPASARSTRWCSAVLPPPNSPRASPTPSRR